MKAIGSNKESSRRVWVGARSKADDISEIESLNRVNETIKPAIEKVGAHSCAPLLDFNRLNITLNNIEKLTFGECLPDSGRSLIVGAR